MSSDTDGWHYASPDTVAGALQRGLGRGAHRAMSAPAAPDPVTDCLRRDYRWDWQVDERDVYLARLVRDLRMPIAPIVARLHDAPPADSDDDNEFAVALGVLEVLGRAGVDGAVDGVRRYIRDGDRRIDALETVSRTWPVPWWDDLYPAITGRIGALTEYEALWLSPPWTVWADRDERIAAAVRSAKRRPGPQRPFAEEPTGALLSLLRRADRADDWRPALRELRRRRPEPGLLDLVEDLAGDRAAGPLNGVVDSLGALAVPAARRWIRTAEHPLAWAGLRLLAAHGDVTDAPALVAGLDWLDARPGDRCGYGHLACGLARIGGPAAAAALPPPAPPVVQPALVRTRRLPAGGGHARPGERAAQTRRGVDGLRGRRTAAGRATGTAQRPGRRAAAIPARRPHRGGRGPRGRRGPPRCGRGPVTGRSLIATTAPGRRSTAGP
ncbi:hypothetical protein [Actinoplanes sp. NPDC049118]|uniref:hypothetical protein n=1 Tax=Actinoplanes sp. NPDC049118 TaxID=3155769 RepID=UPI0033F55E51